ncbi:MAG: Kef family K(+) transporter [Gemmatimonadaceae bacterium]|nr:Kef family K(+) transporter [Gemmatimonadaceae bacterium]
MLHDTALIATITAGLGLAFLLGLAVTRIGLPPIVGYLLAGVLVGPHSPGFTADTAIATQLAEIGVIMLMFGVGLHFSLADLLSVKRVAIPGAIGRIAIVTAFGGWVASLWGWPLGEALVFGLSLSVASTVVLMRALEQRGGLDSFDGRIAIGWLVVEDLVMVLALVLLPAFAASMGTAADPAGGSGGNLLLTLAITLGKVAAFFALVLIAGRRIVPWMLEHVAHTGSRELFTLAVLATALGIALGSAVLFGVSVALGAFFAGVVINGSDLSHQAGAEALPLQDAFAVLFFVSVGMLFDPGILVREPLAVLGTLGIVMIGKSLVVIAIVLLLGYRIRSSLTVAASLSQIGEFSFILAGLAVTLGLLSEEGRDLILAAAILSITLNPLMFGLAGKLERWTKNQPRLIETMERTTEMSIAFPPGEEPLMGHAIIVGFGRVGRTIAETLTTQKMQFVVIESDRAVVKAARKAGVRAVWGDATRRPIFALASPESARLLILAAPGAYQSRQVLELSRRVNPSLDTVVRTHSGAEQAYLDAMGVGRTVLGERETALAMSHYALVSLGHSDDQADAAVEWAREGVT